MERTQIYRLYARPGEWRVVHVTSSRSYQDYPWNYMYLHEQAYTLCRPSYGCKWRPDAYAISTRWRVFLRHV